MARFCEYPSFLDQAQPTVRVAQTKPGGGTEGEGRISGSSWPSVQGQVQIQIPRAEKSTA